MGIEVAMQTSVEKTAGGGGALRNPMKETGNSNVSKDQEASKKIGSSSQTEWVVSLNVVYLIILPLVPRFTSELPVGVGRWVAMVG